MCIINEVAVIPEIGLDNVQPYSAAAYNIMKCYTYHVIV